MPAWDRIVKSSDGILSISNFNVIRLADQRHMRQAHLLITEVVLKEIHEVDQIRFKRRARQVGELAEQIQR